MIHVGEVAREMREALGLTQHEMATALGVTNVHISNIENGKASPSHQLIDRCRGEFGIDLYVMAWCRHGDVEKLPASIREPAGQLARAFQQRFEAIVARRRKAGG